MTSELKHPAVVLEHSEYISSVQCSAKGLRVTFKQKKPYQYAKKAWTAADTFMLVTYTNGCGSSNDQRTFWQIDHLETDSSSLCITAVVQQELAVEDAMEGVDMIWGTYKPDATSSMTFKTPPHPGPTGGYYPYHPKGYPPYGGSSYGPRSSSYHGPTYTTGYPGTATRPSSSGPTGGSSGNSSVTACGKPPAAQIDGFPTAECGSEDFDQQLDDAIGYLSFDDADYEASLRAFAPGLDKFDASENEGIGASRLRRRRLQKRNWFMDNIINVSPCLISHDLKLII